MSGSSANLPPVYRLLTEAHNSAADAVLLRALPTLGAPFAGHALDALLSRARPAALKAVVASFLEWPESLQHEIVARAGAFEPGLRLATEDSTAAARLGAVAIVARSGESRLLYLLNEALVKPCPETRGRAAEGLQRLAERFFEKTANGTDIASPLDLRSEERRLAAAAVRAVRTWSVHHRRETIAVAAWLVEHTAGAIVEMLDRPRVALARALNVLMTERPDPRLADYTIWALSIAQLRDAAAGMLARCDDSEFLLAVARASWRLNVAELRHRVARVRDMEWSRHGLDPVRGLSGWRGRSAVRFLACTGIESESKVALLARCMESGSPDVAAAAFPHLAHSESRLARAALERVSSNPEHTLCAAAAKVLRHHESASGASLFPWSRAARTTNVELLSEEQMYRAAHDSDPRVRSRVMSLLSQAVSPTAGLLLRRALHDADYRVQANAIEALDALDVERLEAMLAEKLESPNARVRANAVQALLRRRARKAGHALLDMLDSPRPEERLSGLWVAERMRLDSLLERIESVAGADPDAQVRERAGKLVARLGRASRHARDPRPAEALSP